MTKPFAWALVGPGSIAHRFAQAVHQLPDTYLHTVVGRNVDKAHAFAATWSRDGAPVPHVTQDLATALRDPAIDAVYIATPHAHHGEVVRQCVLAGKPVLCEKPLVPTAQQAHALVDLARAQGVFLMEALWSRFLPIYGVVADWLQSGAIGPVHAVQSSFCFSADYDPNSRLFNPALAGGSLLDIGIYNLALSRWALQHSPGAAGHCPEPLHLHAHGVLAPTGVDQRVTASLTFPGGVSVQMLCGFDTTSGNSLHILGAQGAVTLPQNFWQATEAVLLRKGEPPNTQHAPFAINGFEGEIAEVMRCVRAGLTESPRMPHNETLALITWMDAIRAQVGVRYPFD
ncbi:MAG: dehydrogenase [Burkholderiales bacterium PBB4]|nr:MAG: dehydrogenase [Burkholderiales bacterium PBB4]